MASACRLCLSSTASRYETIAAIEEKYFQFILPEIDIELVHSPMFCQSCIELLQTTYSFKSNCIETEKMLKLYASSCGTGNILLSDVLQNIFLEKNRIQSRYNDTEAAFNKDIKLECDNDNIGCDLADLAADDLQSCTEIEIKLTEKEINFGMSYQFALCGSPKSTCNESSNDESNKELDRKMNCKTPFQCEHCDKSFRKMKLLIEHIKKHYEQPHCPSCGKAFSNRYGLRRHLLYVHKVDMSENVQLYAQNMDKDKLEDNLQKHLELYKSVVDVEGGESSDDEELHNRQFKCNLCEKSYNLKKCLMDHVRTHFTKSDCKLCGKRLYNVATVKRHLLAVHEIDSGDDVTWRDHISVVVDAPEMEQALKQHSRKEMHDDENKSVSDEDQLDRPYKCKLCKKAFLMKKTLRKHIRVHFTKSNCKLCGKRFCKVNALKRHLLAVHQIDVRDDVPWRDHITVVVDLPEMEEAWKQYNIEGVDVDENKSDSDEDHLERPFICNLCKKAYQMRKDLRDHIRVHFTKTTCNVCGKRYYNVSGLKRHLQTIHQIDLGDDVTWRDNITVVVDEPEMEQAMKEHALESNSKLEEMDDKNDIDCNGEQLESTNTISTISKPRKHTCETCGKQFGQKTSLNTHKFTHIVQKLFICKYCQKGFKSKLYRQRHISVCHLGIRPKRNMERKFICDTCGFSSTYKYNLTQHIRIHTGERPFRCEICDKTFTQGGALFTHKKTVHSTDRFFTCEYCSKSFSAKGTLTKHIAALHLAEKVDKKYICNYCGKKYRLTSQLNSHLKWHTSLRPFSCDVCGKAFVTKHSLDKHSVIHFEEKKHKCNICGKGFHHKYNIKAHMKVHGIVT